jgi:transcriptional regulator GlxA family with amidase domain
MNQRQDALLCSCDSLSSANSPKPLFIDGEKTFDAELLAVGQRGVEAHLASNITSNDLCALVRLSPSHFSRAFKASFGCSPHAHVIARRIDRAKLMMLETSAPLCEVALACGFADQSHFSTKFRRAAGQAPRAWRRVNTA